MKSPPIPLLLMDVATGNVLYQRDANKKWYPASLTKLMTAYVLFKALESGEISEDSVLKISEHALSYPPAKMGFPVGTELTVGNAIRMMIVKSANDIAAALAERLAGSEAAFADRMNEQARRLGMHASHFKNANGLFLSGHVSSARDMALLARQILIEFPQYRTLFQIPAIRHGKRVLRSYNSLLEHFRGANGMKNRICLRLWLQYRCYCDPWRATIARRCHGGSEFPNPCRNCSLFVDRRV